MQDSNKISCFPSINLNADMHFHTQYYLKAQFHFDKDQFADLMIINGIAGTASQVDG